MASPASSQRLQGSGAGPLVTWGRSGEPGSAFSGLGRGRGRGSGRGRGGGRGGRGGARDSKPIGGDSNTSDKPNTTSKDASTPATKPIVLPPSGDIDKSIASSSTASSTRPKGNPRRNSRTIPPVVASSLNGATVSVPGSPSASRPQNRRRRSQSGKSASIAPPKLNVPAHDDNIRPQRHRTGPVPHSAPIKDAPPHLASGTFDIRNNIDALVERVRAVAMAENRPSTPGSHIDWAGDDDDSLPDLDDWGVTTTASVGKSDIISPIVVGGLKPLPDVDIEPSSPFSNTSEISKEPTSDGVPTKDLEAKVSNDLDSKDVTFGAPITTTQQVLFSAPTPANVSLHPSLPAKPKATGGILPNQGPNATSMRNHSIPTLVSPQPSDAGATPQLSVVIENRESEGLAASVHSSQGSNNEAPSANILSRDGLAASIHAPPPGELTESKSAPTNISTYSTTTMAVPEHRTHTRAHTVGRPFPRPENNSRPSRSGYSSPRGGHLNGGGFHARTHSSPPTGLHSHRTPAHRPVITGDAISRLARTIGNTTLSPGRTSTTIAPAHD